MLAPCVKWVQVENDPFLFFACFALVLRYPGAHVTFLVPGYYIEKLQGVADKSGVLYFAFHFLVALRLRDILSGDGSRQALVTQTARVMCLLPAYLTLPGMTCVWMHVTSSHFVVKIGDLQNT
jgi:hypothetical protein